MNDFQPCHECGELESHELHPENMLYEWTHEYEPGCYCADRGKCEVCVDHMIDNADNYRKAIKEGRYE